MLEKKLSVSGKEYKVARGNSPVWDARSLLGADFIHMASILGTMVRFKSLMIWPRFESVTANHRLNEWVAYSFIFGRTVPNDLDPDDKYSVRIERVEKSYTGGYNAETVQTYYFRTVTELDWALERMQRKWEETTGTGEHDA